MALTIAVSNKKENFINTLNGIWFVALFALAAMYLAQFPLFKNLEISPLIIAIVLGMIYSRSYALTKDDGCELTKW